MAVHFFHSSDWHLGQFFFNHSRHYEHAHFLTWLLQQIEYKQPNALLIAGDIFDVINPSSHAQKQLYQFLADAHQLAPHMQTLIIAGNHDSGHRIEQVEPLLQKYNAKAVGVLHKTATGDIDYRRLIIPIYDKQQTIVAWCITLPFLRAAEITGLNEYSQDHHSAIHHVHQQLIAHARQLKTPEQALIMMSHAHMQGGQSSDSERPIIIGNEEALSTDLFAADIDYVALGHLHKPQKVGHPHIRYSGSPIPLSFSEINYPHQIVDVHIDPLKPVDQLCFSALPIPRSLQLHRLRGQLDEIFTQIKDLEQGEITDIEQRDFIDIEYYSDKPPIPNLRQQLEQALPSNRYRLVRIARQYVADTAPTEQQTKRALTPPTPEQLFLSLWQKNGYSADDAAYNDFLMLLDEARQTLEDQSDH